MASITDPARTLARIENTEAVVIVICLPYQLHIQPSANAPQTPLAEKSQESWLSECICQNAVRITISYLCQTAQRQDKDSPYVIPRVIGEPSIFGYNLSSHGARKHKGILSLAAELLDKQGTVKYCVLFELEGISEMAGLGQSTWNISAYKRSMNVSVYYQAGSGKRTECWWARKKMDSRKGGRGELKRREHEHAAMLGGKAGAGLIGIG
ncbi:hypothetical protein EV424DRAFT_1348862 [Suillus variegatus]|nr:hypothetical protein EV424DRAFT_1348862 [Suillus variegatus]